MTIPQAASVWNQFNISSSYAPKRYCSVWRSGNVFQNTTDRSICNPGFQERVCEALHRSFLLSAIYTNPSVIFFIGQTCCILSNHQTYRFRFHVAMRRLRILLLARATNLCCRISREQSVILRNKRYININIYYIKAPIDLIFTWFLTKTFAFLI